QARRPVDLRQLVDRDDIRMVQAGRAPGLAQEPLGILTGLASAQARDLDGHDPSQLAVPGPEDDPEGTPANLLQERELAERLPCRRRAESRRRSGRSPLRCTLHITGEGGRDGRRWCTARTILGRDQDLRLSLVWAESPREIRRPVPGRSSEVFRTGEGGL